MEFVTAGSLVNQAAVELGLIRAPLADPFASTDQNIIRMCQYLSSFGKDWRRKKQWSHLRQSLTFSTAGNQALYGLPPDYDSYVNQSGWNRSTRLPLGGPISPQDYEYLKARLVGVVFTILFQIVNQQFRAYPDTATPNGYIIAFEYMSRWWVQSSAQLAIQQAATYAGQWNNSTIYTAGAVVNNAGRFYSTAAGGTSGTISPQGTGAAINDFPAGSTGCTWAFISAAGQSDVLVSTDTVMFDQLLMIEGLKQKTRREFGLPISPEVAAEWRYTEDAALGTDSPAPTLRMDRNIWDAPLLGERNVPLTGFGQ